MHRGPPFSGYPSFWENERKVTQDRYAAFGVQIMLGAGNSEGKSARKAWDGKACLGNILSLALQVYTQYLLWGLKSINSTYFGLFGAPGYGGLK